MSASRGRPRLAVACRPSASRVRRAVALSKVAGYISGNSIRSKPAWRARLTELSIPRESNSPVNTSAWQPMSDVTLLPPRSLSCAAVSSEGKAIEQRREDQQYAKGEQLVLGAGVAFEGQPNARIHPHDQHSGENDS